MNGIKYDEGYLKVPIWEMVDHVLRHGDEDTRVRMLEELACNDFVIKFVIDQLLDGFTSESSLSGSTTFFVQADPTAPINVGRRRLAGHANEVAADEIEKLTVQLRRAENAIRERAAAMLDLKQELRETLLRHTAEKIIAAAEERTKKRTI